MRRLLSTVGTIRIAYTTQKYVGSSAATEGVDFRAVSSTFDMINGQSSATIYVDTLEDSTGEAERDEYFYVVLTSVQVTSSQLSGLCLFHSFCKIVLLCDFRNKFETIRLFCIRFLSLIKNVAFFFVYHCLAILLVLSPCYE